LTPEYLELSNGKGGFEAFLHLDAFYLNQIWHYGIAVSGDPTDKHATLK
jgi:hypothetical protein